MRKDSRLSVALHLLLHLRELGRVVTSEALGPMMGLNPVVLRRTLSGLRDAGIVCSEKGHGGGWALARGLEQVTLGDVHTALGTPGFFSMGCRAEQPACRVEQAVNRALARTLDDAEALILGQLRSISVADIESDLGGKISQRARKGSRTCTT
jgi:DNA-binding IscR family transcriptional regulator